MSNLDELVNCFQYLDDLRASGHTNMFGAAPYMARKLDIRMEDARSILRKWMDTFDRDTSVQDRATKALEAS